jgi:hypothetical protein
MEVTSADPESLILSHQKTSSLDPMINSFDTLLRRLPTNMVTPLSTDRIEGCRDLEESRCLQL